MYIRISDDHILPSPLQLALSRKVAPSLWMMVGTLASPFPLADTVHFVESQDKLVVSLRAQHPELRTIVVAASDRTGVEQSQIA